MQLLQIADSLYFTIPVMKEGGIGINSSLMWLQREVGDHSMPALNFQGYGVTPWMQPRLDSAMLGLHPDILQTMPLSALQDPRADECPNQSLLQFQQNQTVSCQPAALIQNQVLQQTQSRQKLVQSFQENQTAAQDQVQGQVLQQWLQNCYPYNDQQCQQQLPDLKQLQHQFSDQQQIPKVISTMPQFGLSSQSQPTTLQAVSSTCLQQIFSNITNPVTAADISPMHSLLNSFSKDGGLRQFMLLDCNPLVSSTSLISKRVAVEPQLSSGTAQCSLPQVEGLGGRRTKISELSSLLPPLAGREFSVYQGIGDPQNNPLFGVSMQQNELANIQSNGNENDSFSMPFACSTFPSATGADFPPDSDLRITSCAEKSGFLQSSENVDQANLPSGTFVKVHKSGSFGRSLDISKFSSYHQLHSELARLFGLEGELEDPLRSGWQLVFVTRVNVLLLGDDPWQEFVNSVAYIKILSPQEVQQMGKEGLNLPNSASRPKIQKSISSCNDYTSPQDLRNSSNGMASVSSLDY